MVLRAQEEVEGRNERRRKEERERGKKEKTKNLEQFFVFQNNKM